MREMSFGSGGFVPLSSTGLAAWAAACVVLSLLASSPASATHIFGNINGNPGNAAHNNPNATVTLDPDPVAELQAASQRFLAALATQGFDADGADNNAATANDNWTINQANLSEDSLQVRLYRAYSDTRPAAMCGTLNSNAATVHHTGGALLCLTYHPHMGDPANIRWIQSILTNAPGQNNAADNTTFPGRTLYLDNFGNPGGDPFYDPIGAANGGAFLDGPRRAIGNVDWEADVYVATGNLANRTLTIFKETLKNSEPSIPDHGKSIT